MKRKVLSILDLIVIGAALVFLTIELTNRYYNSHPDCPFEGKECPNVQAVYKEWDDLDTYNKQVVKEIQSVTVNKRGLVNVDYIQYGNWWKENNLTPSEFETMFGFSVQQR